MNHLRSAAPVDTPTEHLAGSIERVTFHSADTGFCVFQVSVGGRRDLVTVVGTSSSVEPGQYVDCEGWWVNDARYGLQFKTKHLRLKPPSTLEGIERYLSSGAVKGIGPHFARKLVQAFGKSVFEVIEQAPERLLELDGIGPGRQAQVTQAWNEQKAVREIMVFLQSHGVGSARAFRIFKTYGNEAIRTVTENPYRLALDIRGVGFKTADVIAQKVGIPRDSLMRAQAGVRHTLKALSSEGHCAAVRGELTETASRLLGISAALIEQAIELECAEGHLVVESIAGSPCLFLASLRRAEVGVAANLQRLLGGTTPWADLRLDEALPWVEREAGITLSPSQRRAVATAITSKVAVITGGPGVGKTTVLKSILHIVSKKTTRIVLCAPTGRAAKRLSESTGHEAVTIHRLLEFDPVSFGFRHGTKNPLAADLVVVDEVSMVDVILMNQLLRAVPNPAALLLVGDADQLPSVGPGAVLSDLIDSGAITTVQLTEVFRQAAHSQIIVNAHRINQGELPHKPNTTEPRPSDFYFIAAATPQEIHDRLLHVVIKRIPERFGLNPIEDIQVLTPMNRGALGAHALNTELQQQLNGTTEPGISSFGRMFSAGDKVIQTVNNYDKEVFNGDIGRLTHIDVEAGLIRVNFDGKEIEYNSSELDELSLAYAITVHKSQGSEYSAVVIPVSTQHYALLERNLLYTAVTRGKSLVVVIGQQQALAMAVRRIRSHKRLTNLAARLASVRSEAAARGGGER